jgi:hypothetical protein
MSNKLAVASVFLAVSLSAFLIQIGCSSKAASVRQDNARALAAAVPRKTVAALAKAPERFTKPAPRDAAFGRYADADHGASFRFPRSFALIESGDDDTDSDRVISWQQAKEAGAGVRTAEELNADDPGANLMATIVVPDDTYPNTAFAGGSIQFAVNRYQSAASCRANLLARQGDAKAPSGSVAAQGGASFAWIDIDAGDGMTEFHERDYAGFANDACFEFFVRVGVGEAAGGVGGGAPVSNAGTDGASSVTSEESASYKPVNDRKIFVQLDKIVASFQAQPTLVSTLDKPKYKAVLASPASN